MKEFKVKNIKVRKSSEGYSNIVLNLFNQLCILFNYFLFQTFPIIFPQQVRRLQHYKLTLTIQRHLFFFLFLTLLPQSQLNQPLQFLFEHIPHQELLNIGNCKNAAVITVGLVGDFLDPSYLNFA